MIDTATEAMRASHVRRHDLACKAARQIAETPGLVRQIVVNILLEMETALAIEEVARMEAMNR